MYFQVGEMNREILCHSQTFASFFGAAIGYFDTAKRTECGVDRDRSKSTLLYDWLRAQDSARRGPIIVLKRRYKDRVLHLEELIDLLYAVAAHWSSLPGSRPSTSAACFALIVGSTGASSRLPESGPVGLDGRIRMQSTMPPLFPLHCVG